MLLPVSFLLSGGGGGGLSTFLTSCVNNFSGKWGRGWGGVNVMERRFPFSFRKYFWMNRIFSVAQVYCDKMSTIPSLGAKKR